MKEEELGKLPKLTIPIANLKIAKNSDGNLKIFDPLRKKYVVLTPEEWVRQNFVAWLVNSKGFPPSLIANEVETKLNGTTKRCDTIIMGRDLTPLFIIEYKAPNIEITQKTFDQIVRYNMNFKVKYLIISNGINTFCCVMDYAKDSYHFIPFIPDFNEANGLPGEN